MHALTWILKAGFVGISQSILVCVGFDAQRGDIEEIVRRGAISLFIYDLSSLHDNYSNVRMMDNLLFWHDRAEPHFPARICLFIFLFYPMHVAITRFL